MKHAFLISVSIFCFAYPCFSQSDTIYAGNKKWACTVNEVTSDSVKFIYPNEALVNSIYKNNVQKIVFRSGQIQVLNQPTTYAQVIGADDWENVSITQSAKEVREFRQVGTVSADIQSSATVTPGAALASAIIHSTGIVKKRFFRKLKMQCAMLGGNLVHLTQADSTSALYLGLAARGAEMNGMGIAYTTTPLDAGAFRAKLNGKTNFTCVEKREMRPKDFNFSTTQFDSVFKLNYVISESGLTYAVGTLNNVSGSQFRVINVTDKYFTLMHKVKTTVFNYIINF